jgi:hypothetical protein
METGRYYVESLCHRYFLNSYNAVGCALEDVDLLTADHSHSPSSVVEVGWSAAFWEPALSVHIPAFVADGLPVE